MKQIFNWLLVALGLVVLILFGCSAYTQSAANRTYAQAEVARARGEASALVIQAHGQSRLDSAQAVAVTQAANLPFAILGIAAVFGISALALAGVLIAQNRQPIPPQRIERIETRIIFLPAPLGATRRDLWRLVSNCDMLENKKSRDIAAF